MVINDSVITKTDLIKAKQSLRFKKSIKIGLISMFAVCSLSPLVFKSITDLNTRDFLLKLGFLSGVLGGIPIDYKEEKLLTTFKKLEDYQIKENLKAEIVLSDNQIEVENRMKIIDFVERLPYNVKDYFAAKLGVAQHLAENWIEPEIVEPVKKPGIELEDKHLWIKQILKEPFKIITGEQGSGKSTFERLLIDLLREQGHHIIIINPETIRNGANDVTVLNSISTINEFFKQFPELVAKRQQDARNKRIDEDDYLTYIEDQPSLKGRVAIFLMESNTYEAHGVNPDLWATFLKQMSTNIRKWGFTAVLTAHSANQTSITSKLKGFSGLLKNAMHIECLADTNSKGEKVGSGKAHVKINNDAGKIEYIPYYKPTTKNY